MTYWIFKKTVLAVLRLCFRPKVDGLENLPAGPLIVASNHLSFIDPFFLMSIIRRRVTFLAKSSCFTAPGISGKLTALFFRGLGIIPVDRAGGLASEPALDASLKVLRSGGLLGIFPEGTRSPDGCLYRGRTGAARLAVAAAVPVVPVAVIGTENIQLPGAIFSRKASVRIRIGQALTFSDHEGFNVERAVPRLITDKIMNELQHLSGRQYIDRYSPGPFAGRCEDAGGEAR